MFRAWHSARHVASLGVGTWSEAWESVGVMVESGEWQIVLRTAVLGLCVCRGEKTTRKNQGRGS